MAIQWFPGHMRTAREEAIETLRATDVVIEVLDARVPGASLNPMFEKIRRELQRPALKLLNKADVADPERTRAWLAHYNGLKNTKAIALSSKVQAEVRVIPELCLALAPHRSTRQKPLRLMILGIPNVGKSTLMNSLLKRKVAKVGDEPAITKMQMRHDLAPGISLVDTPGMLWPGIDPDTALILASTHSIGRNAYEDEEVAVSLGHRLLADYPALVAARYGAPPPGSDGNGLIAFIAQQRGLRGKGDVLDIGRAATQLLTDFRHAALGRITLETPEQAAARAAAVKAAVPR